MNTGLDVRIRPLLHGPLVTVENVRIILYLLTYIIDACLLLRVFERFLVVCNVYCKKLGRMCLGFRA